MDAANGAAVMMVTSSFYILGRNFIFPADSGPRMPTICDDVLYKILVSNLEAT